MDFSQACVVILALISIGYAFQSYRREKALARNLSRWKAAARMEREHAADLESEIIRMEFLLAFAREDAHETARDKKAYMARFEARTEPYVN